MELFVFLILTLGVYLASRGGMMLPLIVYANYTICGVMSYSLDSWLAVNSLRLMADLAVVLLASKLYRSEPAYRLVAGCFSIMVLVNAADLIEQTYIGSTYLIDYSVWPFHFMNIAMAALFFSLGKGRNTTREHAVKDEPYFYAKEEYET